jgi:PIN domain nuclease of toxin-antitoxin system
MHLLIDTHVFLWYLQRDAQLKAEIKDLIEVTENQVYLSIASLWEIAIKLGLGKLELEPSFSELYELARQLSIHLLPITFEDTVTYLDLPLHHRDPFDRMLVAQTISRSYR